MTRPGIEPQSPRPLVNTLLNRQMAWFQISSDTKYEESGPGSNGNERVTQYSPKLQKGSLIIGYTLESYFFSRVISSLLEMQSAYSNPTHRAVYSWKSDSYF